QLFRAPRDHAQTGDPRAVKVDRPFPRERNGMLPDPAVSPLPGSQSFIAAGDFRPTFDSDAPAGRSLQPEFADRELAFPIPSRQGIHVDLPEVRMAREKSPEGFARANA